MPMRLNRIKRDAAKSELLQILSQGPCRTSDLRGTQKFHGERTLSSYQIRSLLRETGRVRETARRARKVAVHNLDACVLKVAEHLRRHRQFKPLVPLPRGWLRLTTCASDLATNAETGLNRVE